MENEEATMQTEQNQEQGMNADTYIAELRRIKETTVDKADFEKLEEENRRLAKAAATGLKEEDDHEDIDVAAVSKRMISSLAKRSDLETISDALAIRKATIESGGDDPFLPHAKDYTPKPEDIVWAEALANGLQECVDQAEGDPAVFTALLKQNGVDFKQMVKR